MKLLISSKTCIKKITALAAHALVLTLLAGALSCNAQDEFEEDCGNEETNGLLGRTRDPMEKPLFNYAPIDE
jgi:hypothetical protein